MALMDEGMDEGLICVGCGMTEAEADADRRRGLRFSCPDGSPHDWHPDRRPP